MLRKSFEVYDSDSPVGEISRLEVTEILLKGRKTLTHPSMLEKFISLVPRSSCFKVLI